MCYKVIIQQLISIPFCGHSSESEICRSQYPDFNAR